MAGPTSTLQTEASLMRSLLTLLKQEQQHLVHADIDALNQLTPQKSQLVTQMVQLARQRHQALGAVGMAAQDAGMKAWFAQHPDDSADLAQWEDLLGLTRATKEINRVNGMLLNKHMAQNQKLLNAMRTPTNGVSNSFYGPSGQTASSSGASRRHVLG